MPPHDPRLVSRLFHIRRAALATLTVLRDCGHVERQLRLAARVENVTAEARKFLASARGDTFIKRWKAQASIIRAGADLFVLCTQIDRGMTVEEKMDLLGCRHRALGIPPDIEFGRLIAEGYETPMLDLDTPDPRIGMLMAAALAVLNRGFLDQHEALRPTVDAFDVCKADQQRIEAAATRGSVIIDGPATIQ